MVAMKNTLLGASRVGIVTDRDLVIRFLPGEDGEDKCLLDTNPCRWRRAILMRALTK